MVISNTQLGLDYRGTNNRSFEFYLGRKGYSIITISDRIKKFRYHENLCNKMKNFLCEGLETTEQKGSWSKRRKELQ